MTAYICSMQSLYILWILHQMCRKFRLTQSTEYLQHSLILVTRVSVAAINCMPEVCPYGACQSMMFVAWLKIRRTSWSVRARSISVNRDSRSWCLVSPTVNHTRPSPGKRSHTTCYAIRLRSCYVSRVRGEKCDARVWCPSACPLRLLLTPERLTVDRNSRS